MFSPACCLALLSGWTLLGDDPHADAWIEYEPGSNAAPGYTTPDVVLGPPERFTGEGVFPGVVSAFNPPFGTDEILSIGVGGTLTVQFDTPVADDAGNPFGIDLLIFGNAFFIDAAFPAGVVGELFQDNGGVIEVSADCEQWFEVEGVAADGPMPTVGWLDAGPYDAEPGTVPTDFTRPVDPAVTVPDLLGLTYEELRDVYGGSGGGVGVDLTATGLASITCVRITNVGDPKTSPNIEIDAFADVANPADINGDGTVGIDDFLIVLASWGACPEPCPPACPADADADCVVGIGDFLIVLGAWDT